LNINITTQNGESITKSLAWTPVGLTILWQADTYTPPFYRGKALLSAQAAVKVIAIPDNSSSKNALSAGNLAYVWKQDGVNVTSASGYAKNSFTFPAPIPSKVTSVKVLASSMDGSASTEKQINLSLSDPFILFYENSPLLGVWYNQPIGSTYSLSKKEFTVSAVPYFFSNTHTDSPVVNYNWTINGSPVNNAGPSITLRNSAGLAGDSLVTLAADGITKVFQSATQSLVVHFTNNDDTSSQPSF
jgi:hypothetical protein